MFVPCSDRARAGVEAVVHESKDRESATDGLGSCGRSTKPLKYSSIHERKHDASGMGMIGIDSERDSVALVASWRSGQLWFWIGWIQASYATCRANSPSRLYLPLAVVKGSSESRKATAILEELLEKCCSREVVSCLLVASREDGVRRRMCKGCELKARQKLKSYFSDSHPITVMRCA